MAILSLLASTSALANPVRGPFVCVPAINPSESPLEFRIRESMSCAEGETLMTVQAQQNGTLLIVPAPPPMSQENREALENYQRYHGIRSSTSNGI